MFDGKQVIRPERLVRYENDMSLIIDDTKSAEDKKRRRDIVVKTDIITEEGTTGTIRC